MKLTNPQAARRYRGEEAAVRGLVLVVVFLLGVVVSAVWFSSRSGHPAGESKNPSPGLSPSTRTVLMNLPSPVQIRFYSVLDTNNLGAEVPSFAGRVEQLLAQYENEAGGKLEVKRLNARTDAVPGNASADGITPFNLEKGDACYLGIAIECSGHKEALPRLAPEWESALESDLSRAIAHLAQASGNIKSPPAVTLLEATAAEEVKRAIPNLDSLSVEQATQILRESALKELRSLSADLETKVKEAQEKIAQAQNGGSEAEQKAAKEHLLQVQAEQMNKIKDIAAKSQAQIQALQKLKPTSP